MVEIDFQFMESMVIGEFNVTCSLLGCDMLVLREIFLQITLNYISAISIYM